MSRCTHDYLLFHGIKSSNIKYKAPELQVITEALEVVEPLRKRVKKKQTQFTASDQTLPSASTFPAPVIVPGDELTYDPEYPRQSVQEWVVSREDAIRGPVHLYGGYLSRLSS